MSINFETKNSLYINLDTLYDTRLATLNYIDPKLAKLAIANGYYERDTDSFSMISGKDFDRVYSLRDWDYIKDAIPTNSLQIVGNFLNDATKRQLETPFTAAAEIYLNVYPYVLTRDQAVKLAEPLADIANNIATIKLVHVPPIEMTPQWCKDRFSLMLMYTEYQDWINLHLEKQNFDKCTIATIVTLVPQIYITRPSDEEIALAVKNHGDPFKAAEQCLAPIVGIGYADIRYWCANIPSEAIASIVQEVRAVTDKPKSD